MRALVIALVLCVARIAAAYPQFQLSSGTVRCNNCHEDPAGGGLLASWGVDEFGDTIARGGDGHFLHGAVKLPDVLQLGGDVRLAALANDVGGSEGTELAVFPMQADVSVRVASGAWSVAATVGARGVVRSGSPDAPASDASESETPSLASYVVSRQHYVMWRPHEIGAYVRAGRFAAPYGLRLVDHTAYVRRYLGFNLLEETYGLGGGYVTDDVEIHGTAFVFDPVQYAGPREAGAAVLTELHTSNRWLVGMSARAGFGDVRSRVSAGLHGKAYIDGASLLFMAEVDATREQLPGDVVRWQLASYAGPVWIPTRGLYVGLAHEAFAEDLQVRSVTRHAADAWVSFLPRAHIEVMLSARGQYIGPHERAYLSLLQVHYTL